MSEPELFKPHALAKAPIISESRVVTPITQARDFARFEEPAWKRVDELLEKMEADLAYWHEHGECRPKNSAPAFSGKQLATS